MAVELTTEYRDRKLTATLKKHEKLQLWWVSVDMGLKIPFDSKLMNSIFTRDFIRTIEGTETTEEYTERLLEGKPLDSEASCELIDFSPEHIEIIWSVNGRVQIETDISIMAYVRRIIDIVLEGKNDDLLRANRLID